MKKILIFLLAIIMILTGCGKSEDSSDAGVSSSSNSDEIVIGMYGGITGPTAFWNTRAKQGVELAIKEINDQGGIDGKQLKLNYQDTQGNKAEASTAVNKLVNAKVDVIFGPPVSGENFVGGPVANTAKVPFVGIVPSAAGIPDIGEYVFRVGSLAQYATPIMLDYLFKEKNIKTMTLVESINNDYSSDLKKISEPVIKENKVDMKVVSIQDGDTDFTAQVSNIVKQNPDGVFLTLYGTEGGLIAKSLRAEGYQGLIFGSDALAEAPYFELGKEATENTILWMPWVPDTSNELIAEFVDSFEVAYDIEPEFIAAFGYDTVYMLKSIFEEVGVDKQAVKDALLKIDSYTGIAGEVKYDSESGEFLHPHYVVEIVDGKYNPLFVK